MSAYYCWTRKELEQLNKEKLIEICLEQTEEVYNRMNSLFEAWRAIGDLASRRNFDEFLEELERATRVLQEAREELLQTKKPTG